MANKAKPINHGTIHHSPKEKFQTSQNMAYAIIAIGQTPHNPPQWALEACSAYLDAVKISHVDKVATDDFTLRIEADDRYLEEVADYIVHSPLRDLLDREPRKLKLTDEALDTAMGEVLPNDQNLETNKARIRRKWKAENAIPVMIDGSSDHPRLARLFSEFLDKLNIIGPDRYNY